MDIQNIVKELYEERDRLSAAITALERLAALPRKPGRPPKRLRATKREVNEIGDSQEATPADDPETD